MLQAADGLDASRLLAHHTQLSLLAAYLRFNHQVTEARLSEAPGTGSPTSAPGAAPAYRLRA